MSTVISRDGTPIAYERQGSGPAVILDEQIAAARASSHWPGLEALAHTLAYDAALYGRPPVDRLATIEQPTLVATGGESGFFVAAAHAVAASVPNADRTTLTGQGHVVDPGAVAAELRRFFG